MAVDKSSLATWTPHALSMLRIVTGFLFLQHGTAKFFGIPQVTGLTTPELMSLIGVAGLLEVVGGALIIIGFVTRPVAFLLSGEMAVAYFMAHASRGAVLSPMINQGESAVLFCFIFLFLSVAGAGAWSLDRFRGRGRS